MSRVYPTSCHRSLCAAGRLDTWEAPQGTHNTVAAQENLVLHGAFARRGAKIGDT